MFQPSPLVTSERSSTHRVEVAQATGQDASRKAWGCFQGTSHREEASTETNWPWNTSGLPEGFLRLVVPLGTKTEC